MAVFVCVGREHSKSQIQVLGVKEAKASSREEMVGLLYHGMSLRATSGTSMNLHSSRSHAIFTISIEQQRTVYLEYGDDASPGEGSSSVGSEGAAGSRALGQERLSAKMHLVDLAGSERIKKSGASGLQQKEAACINLGLLNLRNVIEALIMKLPFVPYRSNKLTRLLQVGQGPYN
jgi:kinesin family protein 4/21/27